MHQAKLPKKAVLVAIALLLAAALAAEARVRDRRGWELLGERTVSDRVETDILVVTRVQGTFRALKFKVFDRAVQFHDVKVHFANGAVQDLVLRDKIPAGGESRAINLEGVDRVIARIEFRYDAQALGGRTARVRVLGLN